MIKYTEEIVNYAINNYKEKTDTELALEMKNKFNLDFDRRKISNMKTRILRNYDINIRTGINGGRFEKGHISHNKDKKWNEYMSKEGQLNSRKTTFKKGNKPANWVPIGTERIGKGGYIEIKLQDGKLNKNWEGKHRHLYKKYYGEIPKNHIVIFADGNIRNFDKENLIVITKNENARLNQNKLRFDDAEITKSAINLTKLMIKTNEIVNKAGD